MSKEPKAEAIEGRSLYFAAARESVAKMPRLELFQFGLFLCVQYLQWSALLMMIETDGQNGIGNFISATLVSVAIGYSLAVLDHAYKITLFLSLLAMSIYFSSFG